MFLFWLGGNGCSRLGKRSPPTLGPFWQEPDVLVAGSDGRLEFKRVFVFLRVPFFTLVQRNNCKNPSNFVGHPIFDTFPYVPLWLPS